MSGTPPNKDDVKRAAEGRWREIVTSLCHINPEVLDGKNHACPCCGGTDRFATFNDFDETGGVNCRRCHSSGNSDGLGTIQWLNGCDFVTALRDVGEHLGIQSGNGQFRILETYDYCDESGELLFQAVRLEPKTFRQRRPDGNGGWTWKIKGVRQVPYRLPELLAKPQQPVIITEGEKDVDRLLSLGLLATCNAGGSGKWKSHHAKHLAGRRVVVLPDNDDAGRQHAEQVAKSLVGVAESVKVLELPDLPDKGDVSDWLDAGGTRDALVELVKETPEWTPSATNTDAGNDDDDDDDDEKPKRSQATRLVETARALAIFWHSPDGDSAYATFEVSGHREHFPVRSKGFKRWLCRQFYGQYEKVPGSQATNDALVVLEGEAIFAGESHDTFLRTAEHGGGYYLDLVNDNWQAIEIGPDGWRVTSDCPVRFRRAKAMLPLPEPERGGRIDELRKFVNCTDTDWPLVLSWLVAAVKPTGPYPVLVLSGEQGSAKSTSARVLRDLVDPNHAPLRSEPREARDLAIGANNAWVLATDNLSKVSAWLSDALCRLATGGGFSTRTLYENEEETIFDATRPCLLTGIEDVIHRGDLLDRSLLIQLPAIQPEARQMESKFWAAYHEARPRILGALLDIVSRAMANAETVVVPNLPRMADFAHWAIAAEQGAGLESGTFLHAYTGNRESAHVTALEACPIAGYIIQLMDDSSEWSGELNQLLEQLNSQATDSERKQKNWPKTARGLSGALRRLTPDLRAFGVDVSFEREKTRQRRRIVTLMRKGTDSTVQTVQTVQNPINTGSNVGRLLDGSDDCWTVGGRSGVSEDATPDDSDGSDGQAQSFSSDVELRI